ncbi:uncharacterized protein V1510DRAFT_361774, partial [Dipodascopsis tothii]|uniref:uncharacterized protein n=1 Tax=Dipodascopsis tothii TaxID=44089 RepID=UPI0034CF77B0
DYSKDIEINDLRNRYTLTKGQTQAMIKAETGADVTTRGRYYPDKSLASDADPPLYLHVTALSRDGLERAPPPRTPAPAAPTALAAPGAARLTATTGAIAFSPKPAPASGPTTGYRRGVLEDKVFIGLDPLPGFNLRGQIVGPMGANVKHIQNETRTRVQIRGHGSQYLEVDTGREADEPLHLHVAGADTYDVRRAVELCHDLLGSIREQYEQHKANPGARPSRRDRGRDRGSDPGREFMTYQSSAVIENAAAAMAAADPYAPYGGYDAYVLYYQHYYQRFYAKADKGRDALAGR